MKLLRAIYGCIESALQWYNLYTQTLIAEGYILNEYYRCVANKNINGKQCTVAWYVDDNKASHVDSRVIDDLLGTIKTHFVEIKITRGKNEQGKKFLYLKVLRAIYGCIESALQWYNLYTQTLKAEGYIIISYL